MRCPPILLRALLLLAPQQDHLVVNQLVEHFLRLLLKVYSRLSSSLCGTVITPVTNILESLRGKPRVSVPESSPTRSKATALTTGLNNSVPVIVCSPVMEITRLLAILHLTVTETIL
jgi:hypothetical protein